MIEDHKGIVKERVFNVRHVHMTELVMMIWFISVTYAYYIHKQREISTFRIDAHIRSSLTFAETCE